MRELLHARLKLCRAAGEKIFPFKKWPGQRNFCVRFFRRSLFSPRVNR
jgi:hypothetical protein